MSATDEMFTYHLIDPSQPSSAQNIQQTPHQPQGISDFRKKANRIEQFYSKRLGTVIGQVECLVQVDMLVGLKQTESGALVKEYAPVPGQEPDYAIQTIVDEVTSEDQRFIEREALPLPEEFPEGTKAFFLGDMAYGRPLQVTGHTADKQKAEVWVSVLKGREPDFGHDIARDAERQDPYQPSYRVAQMLNLHPLVLSKLTSAFNVLSSGLRLNLGLNLKFEAKKLKVLGYSRKNANGWEYSNKAIALLSQYMTKFPQFIATIAMNPTGDGWEDTSFYPDPTEAKAKMKEIGQWLKSVETKGFERVPLEAMQLDEETVKKIEAAADANNAANSEVDGKKISAVPRSALLKPSDAIQRTARQRFAIGDRVVYVLDSGRVPIAMRGTVVGMTRTTKTTLLDVVFDHTFMSGTTLNERCSPFRGSTVPSEAVVNLSDRQVLSLSEAAKARQTQQHSLPLRSRGPATHAANAYGPPGQQLRPADQPAPLQGSYRGAFGGQQNGAPRGNFAPRGGRGGFAPLQGNNGFQPRGRGGMLNGAPRGGRGGNRGGYNTIDNTDPMDGVVHNNTAFRPQSYANVPPPSNLNEPGRGRGRGAGRSRGRGGRGRGGAAPAAAPPS
jgi:5'-3' exoribonuclease 1